MVDASSIDSDAASGGLDSLAGQEGSAGAGAPSAALSGAMARGDVDGMLQGLADQARQMAGDLGLDSKATEDLVSQYQDSFLSKLGSGSSPTEAFGASQGTLTNGLAKAQAQQQLNNDPSQAALNGLASGDTSALGGQDSDPTFRKSLGQSLNEGKDTGQSLSDARTAQSNTNSGEIGAQGGSDLLGSLARGETSNPVLTNSGTDNTALGRSLAQGNEVGDALGDAARSAGAQNQAQDLVNQAVQSNPTTKLLNDAASGNVDGSTINAALGGSSSGGSSGGDSTGAVNAVFGSMDSGNSATQAVQSGQSVLSFNTAAQEAGSNAGNLLNAVASGRNVDAAINNQVGGTANSQDVQAFSKAVGDRLADGGSTNDAIGQGSQAVQTATQSRQEADNADPTLKAVAQGTDPSNGQGGESFNQALGQALNNGEAPAQAVSQAETAQETTNQEQAVAGTAEAAQPPGTTAPGGEAETAPTVVADAGTAAGGTGADGAPVDGTPADGTPTDGTPTDGTPADGQPTDGTPADGTPTDGTPTDGEPVDGTPTDGEPTDGTPTDGEPVDGTPTDGEPTDGTPTDGEPADGTPTDGEPTDGEPTDGTPTDGEPTDGTPTDGEPTDGTPTDGTPTDGTPIDGTDQDNGPVVTTLQVSDPLTSSGQIGGTTFGAFGLGTPGTNTGTPGTGGPTDPLTSTTDPLGGTSGSSTSSFGSNNTEPDTDTGTESTSSNLSVLDDADTAVDGGGLVSGNLLSNDNGTGSLSISSATGSLTGSNGGLFTLAEDGNWTFDPGQDFDFLNEGDSTDTEIIVSVSSSDGLTQTQTLTITVTGQDDGTVAVDDGVTVDEVGASSTLNVLANDTDVDGFDTLQVDSYSNDQGVTVLPGTPLAGDNGGLFTIAADGSVTFTAGSDFDSLSAGQSAQSSITYTLIDDNGNVSSATLTATVNGIDFPSVAVDDSLSVQDGQTSSTGLNVFSNDTDADGAASQSIGSYGNGTLSTSVAGTAIAGTNGGQFSIDANGNLTFAAGADFESLGPGETAQTSITYVLIDDHGNESSATATVTVTGADDPTIAVDDTLSVAETGSSSGALNVFTNEIDPDGSAIQSIVSYTNGTSTTTTAGTAMAGSNGGLFTIAADGSVTFDTNGAFNALSDGQLATTAVTYTMEDQSGNQSAATVTATVTGTDTVGVAVADTLTVTEGAISTNVLNVFTNDTDVDGAVNRAIVSYTNGTNTVNAAGLQLAGNNGGLFTITAAGLVTFDTNNDFNALGTAQTNTTSITYTFQDGSGLTSSATVTATVNGVDDPVVAVADSFTVTEDSGSTNPVNVLTNDTDAEGIAGSTVTSYINGVGGTALAGFAVGGNNGGQFTIAANGDVTFDPGTDFNNLAGGASQTTAVTYTVQDAGGNTDTATLTATVTGINDAPTTTGNVVLNAFTKTTGTPSFQISSATLLGSFADAEGDIMTVQNLALASGSTDLGNLVQDNATTWTYTPVGGADATASFTFDVTDGNGGTTQGTASVNQSTAATTAYTAYFGLDNAHGVSTNSLNMTSFTIEMLYKPNTITSTANGNILTLSDGGGYTFELFHNGTTEALGFTFNYNGDSIQGETLHAFNSTTTWRHIALTFDAASKTVLFYLDGASSGRNVGSTGTTQDFSTYAGNLELSIFNTDFNSDAHISELRIWNDVRTSGEIATNYNAQVPATSTNLVANYRFGDTGGSTTTTSLTAADEVLTGGFGALTFKDQTNDNPWGVSMWQNGTTIKAVDPILFDLGGDGLDLLGAEAGVEFDMDGDGTADPTGWFGPNEGLLVSDLNQNGAIDSLREVISPAFNPDGRNDGLSRTSMEVLALYDDDANGIIDAADEIFASLSIWQDANSDGITDLGELFDLEAVGITAIEPPDDQDLAEQTAQTDEHGNVVELTGEADTQQGDRVDWYQVSFAAGSEGTDQEGYTSTSGTDPDNPVEDPLTTGSV